MTVDVEKSGSLANAVNQYKGKQDWSTRWELYYKILDMMNVNPKVDVCATKKNAKCDKYITPEQDFFKTDVYEDAFMNAEYQAGNLGKGIRGIGHFHARLYHQHIYHNICTVTLIPSTAISTSWFETYYGERLFNQFGEKADVLFIRKRQKFTDGPTNGGPPFSSLVFVHRRKTELELHQIRQRYEEHKEKLLW